MFTDTHSHLNFKQFDTDREQVINRAHEAGVGKIIVVGSDLADSIKALEIAKKSKHLFASVGLHPNNVGLNWQKQIQMIEKALDADEPVALGEIGLDYHKLGENKLNKRPKIEAFESLLNLAQAKELPVILHCREALKDFLSILATKANKIRGVWHCFQGGQDDAQKAFDLGLLISFTGVITFSREYDEVIKHAPLEKIMIETDCPFLTPEPYRGERNEPSFVVEVARRIAEIKNIPLYKVAEQTTKNAVQLFGLEIISNLANDFDSHVTTPRQ